MQEAEDLESSFVRDELKAALAASGTGTWCWDAASGRVRWDSTLEALSGLPPGGFGATFEAWLETLHPDEVDSILAQVNDAIERRSSYHFEHRTIWPDGTVRWLECRGQVTVDAAGNFTGTVGCAVDITERRESEERRGRAFERERRLRDRLEFLVRADRHGGRRGDHREFMRSAAAAAVPKLGDWCSIHYIPDDGAEVEIVVAHVGSGQGGVGGCAGRVGSRTTPTVRPGVRGGHPDRRPPSSSST